MVNFARFGAKDAAMTAVLTSAYLALFASVAMQKLTNNHI